MKANYSIRVGTYNIRSIWALDKNSFWWLRRNKLKSAITQIESDIWGMQEISSLQASWLDKNVFENQWKHVGRGRMRRGGGESCTIWARSSKFKIIEEFTRWYGGNPTEPGSKLPDASFPRIATAAKLTGSSSFTNGEELVIVNTHLDEHSEKRRSFSLAQLAEWIETDFGGKPVILVGDFNCPLDAPPCKPIMEIGLRPVLNKSHGPTANNFGKNLYPQQIDHIFVSKHYTTQQAFVVQEAGMASDHWPVVAELSF